MKFSFFHNIHPIQFVLFILSITYGYLVVNLEFYLNHVLNLTWILLTVFFFLKIDINKISIKQILTYPIIISSGLLLGAIFFTQSKEYFFVFDTYHNYFPKMDKLIAFFKSGTFFTPGQPFFIWENHFLFFDIFNSIAYYFFGKSVYILVTTLAIYKILTCYFIFKLSSILGYKKFAKYSMLIYILNPVYLMHTTYVFKEAFIHFLIVTSIFYLIKSKQDVKPLKSTIYFFVLSFICIWDRMYLAIPLFICVIAVNRSFIQLKKINHSFLLFGLMIVATTGVFIFSLTKNISLLNYLLETRKFYGSYSDVNYKLNYEIGYALAFLKTMFTPFFAKNKFTLFTGFSNLIIWGSFVNTILLLCVYVALFFKFKSNSLFKMFFFIIFSHIAFIAFIAPYGFRQRDSLAPLFSILSPIGFNLVIQYLQKNVHYIRVRVLLSGLNKSFKNTVKTK